MHNVGVALRDGEGVAKNTEVAMQFFLKAAAKGHARAEYSAGCMYESGNGVELNLVRALKCFEQAAERGYKNAHPTSEKLSAKLGKKQEKYARYGGALYAQRVEVVDPPARGLTEAYAAGLAVAFDHKKRRFQVDLDSGKVAWLSSTHCVAEGTLEKQSSTAVAVGAEGSGGEGGGGGSRGGAEAVLLKVEPDAGGWGAD